jgi:soluble lytic murein transglycosylase-like protein
VNKYLDLFRSLSIIYNLPLDLIIAIAEQESNYETGACRYEPFWSYLEDPKKWADSLHITLSTETHLQCFSWGLMQIMGSVARELGFSGYLHELAQPELGLAYGCMKLKQLKEHYGNELDVIAAYNQGGLQKVGDLYKDQNYVDSVVNKRAKIKMILNI